MSEPVERQLMPGVFMTDFRTSETRNATAAANRANSSNDEAKLEEKLKEEDELRDEEETNIDQHNDAGQSHATSSSSSHQRVQPSTFPLDIPNDIESIELELEALNKNLMQLIKSNEILQEELKEAPEDQDFIDAIRENRVVILRRSERMHQLQKELRLLAPHRAEAINTQLIAAIAEQQQAAQREQQQPSPTEEEQGGIFL